MSKGGASHINVVKQAVFGIDPIVRYGCNMGSLFAGFTIRSTPMNDGFYWSGRCGCLGAGFGCFAPDTPAAEVNDLPTPKQGGQKTGCALNGNGSFAEIGFIQDGVDQHRLSLFGQLCAVRKSAGDFLGSSSKGPPSEPFCNLW